MNVVSLSTSPDAANMTEGQSQENPVEDVPVRDLSLIVSRRRFVGLALGAASALLAACQRVGVVPPARPSPVDVESAL